MLCAALMARSMPITQYKPSPWSITLLLPLTGHFLFFIFGAEDCVKACSLFQSASTKVEIRASHFLHTEFTLPIVICNTTNYYILTKKGLHFSFEVRHCYLHNIKQVFLISWSLSVQDLGKKTQQEKGLVGCAFGSIIRMCIGKNVVTWYSSTYRG